MGGKINMETLGVMLAMAGPALAFWPWSAEPFTLPKIAAMLAGALLAHAGAALSGRRNAGTHVFLVASWGLALVLATLSSSDMSRSLVGGKSLSGGSLLCWAALALSFSAAVASAVDRKRLVACASLTGGLLGLGTAVQSCGFWPVFPQLARIFGGRTSSLMGGPVPLGAVLAACLPACVWLALSGKRAHMLAFILCAWGLQASGTRAAMGGAAAGVLLVLFLRGALSDWMASALTALAAMVSIVLRANGHGSDLGRVEIWRIAWHSFLDRPLLGWGPDTFEVVMRRYIGESFVAVHGGQVVHPGAHNLILQVLCSTGLVGLVLLAFGFLLAQPVGVQDDDAPAIGGALALLCCSLVNPVPTAALGLVLCLCAPMFRREQQSAGRMTPSALAGISVLLLAGCLRLAAADSHAYNGYVALGKGDGDAAAVEFARAAEMNPLSSAHAAHQLDMLRLVAASSRTIEDARATAGAGLSVAEQNARLHAQDPQALDTLASQQALAALLAAGPKRQALRAQAEATMKESVRMAPTFKPGVARLAAIRRGI